ncbi:MAG: DASH family cryptochrome [Saprospiraceae bacterium]|nr:DASH family cryptochrome [Saprospiraceae bacterium]
MTMESRALLWFRQDLRLHDNEALWDALNHAEKVIPVYVFDERLYGGKTRYGFPKIDHHRRLFIMQSVLNLKKNLQDKGSNLIIRIGKPEEELFELARHLKVSWICCNRERTAEEVNVQETLEKKLWTIGLEIRYNRGKMLYYTQDLPFPIYHTPETFTQYKKEVDRIVPIRTPLPTPQHIPWISEPVDPGKLPDLGINNTDSAHIDIENQLFKGGEDKALERLNYFFWQTDGLSHYKHTRNDLLGSDYSSRFSPWLAQGCLSPKRIYHELKCFESEHGASEHTYAFYLELLWRDYFRLNGKKYGNALFLKGGLKGKPNKILKDDLELFKSWATGLTGIPMIDANMNELNQTGFMSNRGRQLVASFLVKDLEINWQMGAEYFESKLIDYDPCSNWGNWNYIAGVGNDPREDRYFNILTQSKRYDPEGLYVRRWLPQLAHLPSSIVHCPDGMNDIDQQKYGLVLGVDYPLPQINTERWIV